jgi:hypothetical protein
LHGGFAILNVLELRVFFNGFSSEDQSSTPKSTLILSVLVPNPGDPWFNINVVKD